MNLRSLITLIVTITVIMLISTYFLFFQKQKINTKKIHEQTLFLNKCLNENQVAYSKIYEKKRSLSDSEATVVISVFDKNNNSINTIFQIDNVWRVSHPIELHKCGIYVIRMFNYDYKKTKQNPGYRDELWRYDYTGEGSSLLLLAEKPNEFVSYYSPNFRVDPYEKFIVLEKGYLWKDDYALIIKNLNTKEDVFILSATEIFKRYPNIIGSFNMREWSKDGRYFWGDIFEGAYVKAYFRIDTKNWTYDIYEAPEGAMGGMPLNINTGYVPIQPGLVWVGDYQLTQELKEKYRKEGKKSSLYLYNLFTKDKILLEITDEPLWYFKPKWISDTELEYELPTGEKKIYKLNK